MKMRPWTERINSHVTSYETLRRMKMKVVFMIIANTNGDCLHKAHGVGGTRSALTITLSLGTFFSLFLSLSYYYFYDYYSIYS